LHHDQPYLPDKDQQLICQQLAIEINADCCINIAHIAPDCLNIRFTSHQFIFRHFNGRLTLADPGGGGAPPPLTEGKVSARSNRSYYTCFFVFVTLFVFALLFNKNRKQVLHRFYLRTLTRTNLSGPCVDSLEGNSLLIIRMHAAV